ncbi:MAG TPA: response regulator [Kofleriaceae bacterium]|nr:response regulator [Kofleriaceae bacterium]
MTNTVMIVDDFEDARELMGELLRHWGFDVIECADGSEAMSRAETDQPDVILMDMSMPVVDGWEATRYLKQNARTQHIPIIALTSHALIGSSDPAFQAGCDAFLARPCPPQRVLEEVKRMLRKSKPRPTARPR